MDMIKGRSTTQSPLLDGTNYAHWKPCMTSFLKSIDSESWKAVISGWEPPMILVEGKSTPKPESDWTDAEDQASRGNACALNAIYNGVDQNVFKLIHTCSSAKEAWKSLEVAYEGIYFLLSIS
ncbi:uncharacterized protein LOC116403561 [Cucumis sativus]|uniref:uncharacterized protein LOC116403561 n=1 Tax=Cucumis sativus TaxID=3659 RepID=UPI0012F4F8FE|nr:uncharacterized protein LOC116403561 [Cucumis sativus]